MAIAILASLLLAAAAPVPAAAQAPATTPAEDMLSQRGEALVALLAGSTDPAALFAPSFLAQIPAEQVRAVAAQLRAQLGAPLKVARIADRAAASATIFIEYERGTVQLKVAFAAEAPHLVTGLLVAGTELKADSAEAVLAGLRALPGQVSIAVATLGDAAPADTVSIAPDRPMAIGSAFKLFILAELVREVKAGERHWADVVPLSRHSLPSGQLQDWPIGSPITLHSLAALMISRSDNSAADSLLAVIGRDKVEHLLPALGVRAADRDRPFLSTFEAFALKADSDALRRWSAAGEAERRAMLPALDGAHVDVAMLAGAPRAIDRVEWFASADDLVRTMDWLRRNGDPTALALLAINPGIAPAAAAGFDYVGYKGGSENGVLNLTWLVRRKDGGWRAVSASWNDPAAPVDESKLIGLVGRMLALQR